MQLADRIPNLLEGISCVTKDRQKAYTEPPACAGVIHTDFERGFIRAETLPLATSCTTCSTCNAFCKKNTNFYLY